MPTANLAGQEITTGRLASNKLEQLLSITNLNFDLYEGTVVDPADTRIIFLSTDILRGIHTALNYEAGSAWRLILYRCGLLWGQRTCRTLSKQSQMGLGSKFDLVSVDDFITHLQAFLNFNGWGVIKFYLDDAVSHGLIRAELQHSIFPDALPESRERVDFMVSGMLAGLLGELARAELASIEISSPLTGAEASVFLISAKARIEALEPMVESGASPDEILRRIRQ